MATGGTGGHIYPALAVAAEAQLRGAEVAVIGGAGGMEEQLTAQAGIEFLGVTTGKWNRQRPDPRQALRAAAGLKRAVDLVRRWKPHSVVGFGGFASMPGCFAATVLGIPLVLHEGNAFPSRVNRWFAGRSRLVIVAQAEALKRLATKTSLVIPFPVREESVDRQTARQALGLPQSAVVTLVMGGSQGSLALNKAVPIAFRTLSAALANSTAPKITGELATRELHVLHSTGPRWHANMTAENQRNNYHLHAYLNASHAWAAADLAITRAGVGTLSEAAFHGVPTIMVPLPTSAENHQLHNAKAVAAAGAGMVVEEHGIADLLPAAWESALRPSWLQTAAAAQRARTPLGAARRIVDAVLEMEKS